MLGIVIVTYKSTQLTIDFINREMKNIDVAWVCCVVNNSATKDDTAAIAAGVGAEVVDENLKITSRKVGHVYIISSFKNLGFAKGNNLGAMFLTKNFQCDYLLFSNNDIEIHSSNCLSTLIKVLESNNKIGAVGPRIINKNFVEQKPHYNIITPYRQIGWMLFPFLRKKIYNKKKNENKSITRQPSGFTYWVQGSFLLMKTDVFLKVGMFDPNTFLYAEEPILAEKLKRIGKGMYYENSVTVMHYEGSTILKKEGKSKSELLVMESNCYYYKKYLHYHPILIWLYKNIFKLTQ